MHSPAPEAWPPEDHLRNAIPSPTSYEHQEENLFHTGASHDSQRRALSNATHSHCLPDQLFQLESIAERGNVNDSEEWNAKNVDHLYSQDAHVQSRAEELGQDLTCPSQPVEQGLLPPFDKNHPTQKKGVFMLSHPPLFKAETGSH